MSVRGLSSNTGTKEQGSSAGGELGDRKSPRGQRYRSALIVLVKLAVAGAILLWLVSKGYFDSRAFAEKLEKNTSSLLVAFLLIGLQGVGNAIRLYVSFKLHGVPVSLARSTSLTWIAFAFNQILPAGAGGDAVRAYYAAQDHPHAKGKAIVAVLFDKVLGLFGLLLLGVAPWVIAAVDSAAIPEDAAKTIRIIGATMAAGFGVAAAFALVALSPRGEAWAARARLRARPFARLGQLIERIDSLAAIHRGARLRLLWLTAFSAALHLLSCVALYLLADFRDQQSFILHLSVWAVVFLTTAIPLSPGGIGVSEAAAAKLWLLCGVTGGAATYFAFRVLHILHATIGLGVYVSLRKRSPAIVEAAKRS